MAPKAEKKPAEKKPAEEKKSTVAEKAPAEKKPKAGKKLPKEGGAGASDKKKKRTKKSVETYKIYIFKKLDLLDPVYLSGNGTTADVFCTKCNAELGWKYIQVDEPTTDIREGRIVLNMDKLLYWNGHQLVDIKNDATT